MGQAVFIVGPSGSGKSSSLSGFKDGEVGVFNVLGKPMPFRDAPKSVNRPGYDLIAEKLAENTLNCYVVDDSTFLMQQENFNRAFEHGYTKFTEMAKHFFDLIQAAMDTDEDTVVYFLHHSEVDETGRSKPRTIGKMLDSQSCIDGACVIYVDVLVDSDGNHVFSTQSTPLSPAKCPPGLMPPTMPNDLKKLDGLIRDYFGLAPLKPAKPSIASEKDTKNDQEKEGTNDAQEG